MKKSMKKLLSLVMVIAALAALTVPALAADAVVSRQGTNGLVIETTGSGYTDTDLFGNFKNVMPGDELTENITIKNNVSGFDYVKLYIRAEAHDEEGNPLSPSRTRTATIRPTSRECETRPSSPWRTSSPSSRWRSIS